MELDEIKRRIALLPLEEYGQLRHWFFEKDWARLDDKPVKDSLWLEARNKQSIEKLLSILATGMLRSIQVGSISVENAHRYLFNPNSTNILDKFEVTQELKDAFNSMLFLEDLIEMVDPSEFSELLQKYEREMQELTKKSTNDRSLKHKWLQVKNQ